MVLLLSVGAVRKATNRQVRFDTYFGKVYFYHLCIMVVVLIDHKFGRLDEMGISMVHNGNATRSDLMIDGSKAAEENVVKHKDSVLLNPVSGRVGVMGLKGIENGLDTINIYVSPCSSAMLFSQV